MKKVYAEKFLFPTTEEGQNLVERCKVIADNARAVLSQEDYNQILKMTANRIRSAFGLEGKTLAYGKSDEGWNIAVFDVVPDENHYTVQQDENGLYILVEG